LELPGTSRTTAGHSEGGWRGLGSAYNGRRIGPIGGGITSGTSRLPLYFPGSYSPTNASQRQIDTANLLAGEPLSTLSHCGLGGTSPRQKISRRQESAPPNQGSFSEHPLNGGQALHLLGQKAPLSASPRRHARETRQRLLFTPVTLPRNRENLQYLLPAAPVLRGHCLARHKTTAP